LAADLLAAQMDVPAEMFCERVISEVASRVTTTLVSKVLRNEDIVLDGERDLSSEPLLARALGTVSHSDLVCQLRLRKPVVGIGAPVEAYLPSSAQQLHTELVVPPHAEVASAVGAVVGGVVQQIRVTIRPLDTGQHFRLLLPDGPRDLNTVEESVAYALQVVPKQLRMLARQAGADQVEVRMSRVDHKAPIKEGWGHEIYLSTELTFTAVGRPCHAKA
jgi:N-methylhydantoinase A/oxoprolinase/acetone carboxylase beta subunit